MEFSKKIGKSGNFIFTKHAVSKMRFYGISENKLKKIFRKPDRTQVGVAPETIALMQRTGVKKKTEIWLMYEKNKERKIRIVTAWRFPGTSPEGEVLPIPKDILRSLN